MVIERRKTARFAACPAMSNPVNGDLCTTIIPKPVIPSAASGARNPRGCFQRWFPMHPLPRRADRGRQNGIATMIRFLPSCHWYENSLCSTTIRHSGGEPAPYPDTGPESSLPSLPTLDYRRKDCRHFHLPWCRWQPAWLIAMKIGHVKPVVGATLVVARSRRQPVFIPLCGLRNAMVIPRSAATKNLQSLPRRRRDFLSQSLPPTGERHREGGLRNSTHGD